MVYQFTSPLAVSHPNVQDTADKRIDYNLYVDHRSDRERYRHSNEVRLVGGFTEAWSVEMTTREGSLI